MKQSCKIKSDELLPVIAMKSPWEAAEESFPGGFEAYFEIVLGCKIIGKEHKKLHKCEHGKENN